MLVSHSWFSCVFSRARSPHPITSPDLLPLLPRPSPPLPTSFFSSYSSSHDLLLLLDLLSLPPLKQVREGKLSFLRRGDERDEILRVSDSEREAWIFIFVHPDLLGPVGSRAGLAGRVPRHRITRRHAVRWIPQFVARRVHVVVSARTWNIEGERSIISKGWEGYCLNVIIIRDGGQCEYIHKIFNSHSKTSLLDSYSETSTFHFSFIRISEKNSLSLGIR